MSSFPITRLRRLRRTGALRDLVRETTLSLDDLVQPLFVAPAALPNERLPGLARHTVESVVGECDELVRLGVTSVILFGLATGAEVYGLPGALIALPLLAVCRAIWEFFIDRIRLEPWSASDPLPVEVGVEPEGGLPAARTLRP